MGRRPVLLIDDDIDLLHLLGAAFSRRGYAVHLATNGRIGMKLFQSIAPDIIVTDLVMPTQEGIETILAMRQVSCHVKIIAMSGAGPVEGQGYLVLASHLGADRVIAKPFAPGALVDLVDEVLGASAAS